jgi:hypothetical protein
MWPDVCVAVSGAILFYWTSRQRSRSVKPASSQLTDIAFLHGGRKGLLTWSCVPDEVSDIHGPLCHFVPGRSVLLSSRTTRFFEVHTDL